MGKSGSVDHGAWLGWRYLRENERERERERERGGVGSRKAT